MSWCSSALGRQVSRTDVSSLEPSKTLILPYRSTYTKLPPISPLAKTLVVLPYPSLKAFPTAMRMSLCWHIRYNQPNCRSNAGWDRTPPPAQSITMAITTKHLRLNEQQTHVALSWRGHGHRNLALGEPHLHRRKRRSLSKSCDTNRRKCTKTRH